MEALWEASVPLVVPDSDCKAAMRLCRKFCSACAVSVLDAALADEDDAGVLPLAAAVLSVAALVPEVAVTSTEDNAANNAASKPPPGGVDAVAVAAVDVVSLLEVLWFSCASRAVNADSELVEAELATELTLICCS